MADIDIKDMLKDITYEDFIEMKKKMDEAENDTTPYAIVDDDEVSVVGDVNKTEVVKQDYVIQFAYPNTPQWKQRLESEGVKILKETPNYIGVERHYKDVWVPPRVYTAVQTAFGELYQFFNVVMEDGTIRDLNEEEIVQAIRMLSQEMMESMCHAVATVLRIPQAEEQCMLPTMTMAAVIRMIQDFPEIVNGMDFFTDKSSETELKVL